MPTHYFFTVDENNLMVSKKSALEPSSKVLFRMLDFFNIDYVCIYLKAFNNLHTIYKRSTKEERDQFIKLFRPLHDCINKCFDEFVKSIPVAYKTTGWQDYGKFERVLNAKGGFQVKKGFFNAVRDLEKERKIFEKKEWLLEERLVTVLQNLCELIKYVTSEAHFIKSSGNTRFRTTRNLIKRIQWCEYVEDFKQKFGKFPRYIDLVEDTWIYNHAVKKWVFSKAYYGNCYQLPERTHSRYRIEYKKGTILHFYKD